MESSAKTYHFLVKSAERTIKLIELIASAPNSLSFTEIKESLSIPKSSLSYLLEDLENYGYVTRSPVTLRYTKGMRMMEYCILCANNTNSLSEINLELEEISRRSGEAAHAGVLDGRFVTYISKINGNNNLVLTSNVGLRTPAHSTALGRVLLAELDDDRILELLSSSPLEKMTPFTLTEPKILLEELSYIRNQGYALEFQQSVLNAACLAVPVYYLNTKKVMFSISVTTDMKRMVPEFQHDLLEILQEASHRISVKINAY